jgi:lysophospholipid acyltransferase (LPLAT)-like uncharacterized protein
MKRWLLDSPTGVAIIARLAAAYIRLVWRTGSWSYVGREEAERHFAGRTGLVCFWHGRMIMLARAWPGERKLNMLISAHRDGRLIARTVGHFGIATVVGSTSRGAAAGLRAMLTKLRVGEACAITPDGPRGPNMRAQLGVASIAKLAGVSVLPVSYSTARAIELGSWDRMLLPLPFGRGVVVCGAPIDVPTDADDDALERKRLEIEEALNRTTREADRLCGRRTPEPAATAR